MDFFWSHDFLPIFKILNRQNMPTNAIYNWLRDDFAMFSFQYITQWNKVLTKIGKVGIMGPWLYRLEVSF